MGKAKTYPLEQSPIYRLPSRRKLAALLKITEADLYRLSSSGHLCSHFAVAKKGGGTRLVDNPKQELKRLQALIARLLCRIAPPEYLYCPVKGRSYVSNAAKHRNNRVIHSLDIKKYFPSTPSRRVYWFFHEVMRCPSDVAALLARLACCDGYLPTGSPLSPIMAYFAHLDVWERVARIAHENGCALSVYIDDLTIFGAKVPTAVIWQIKEAIHGSGLRYHKEKRSVDRVAEITGVIIRDGNLAIPNRQHQKLRLLAQAKQKCQKAPQMAALTARISGMRGHIAQITEANSCGRESPG